MTHTLIDPTLILEVNVDMIVELDSDDNETSSMYQVTYLVHIMGQETVVVVWPTSKEILLSLPRIDQDTMVQVRHNKDHLSVPKSLLNIMSMNLN